MQEFNALEGLDRYNPEEGRVLSTYSGPGKEYTIGKEYNTLLPGNTKDCRFRIGDLIQTDKLVSEYDHLSNTSYWRPIGTAEVIDIIDKGHKLQLRVRYKMVNNKHGKKWLHYSDIDLDRAIWKEKA